LQVPLHRFAIVRALNRWLIQATVRWLMWRQGIRRPISWFVLPHLSFLVGTLGERLSVYYCTDDHAALPHVNPKAIRFLDAETTRNADVVFVASATLLNSKQQQNPRTYLSPHGVDSRHFGRAQDESLAIPEDTAALPGPVIGFFGLIEDWIDLELVDYLAQHRPQWTFLMIGRVAVPAEKLPRRPNVHFIGPRPYDSLPAYGKQFAASIIPYRLTQQVLHANPLKLREYLAMGKPIVAVSTPEIDKYADVVAIARTREDYLSKLDEAVSRPASAEEVRRRMERVAAHGWDARLREVFGIVEKHLDTEEGSHDCPDFLIPSLSQDRVA
jgi:glycosyltransferase involved in cell wall biosynthesis